MRAFSLPVAGVLVWTLVLAGCSGSSTSAITLAPATGPSLNPGGTVTITATVAHDKTNQGVTWTLSGPGTLSGNTTTSVVYTAPSNLSTATTATITATSVASTGVTATESITLNAVLTITTTSLPSGTLGVPYDAFVNAAGATGTFTWTVTSGSLPIGLTLLTTSTSTSAEITGTPTVLETSKFSVQVTDAAGASVTQALSITINPPPPLSVVTGSLANGTVGVGYSQNLQASSGVPPYTWTLVNGTVLPPNLSLAPNGLISGTPTAVGTSLFTVQVQDSSTPTPQKATANLSIAIALGNGDNSKLSGNYAFSVRGFDPNGAQLPLWVAAGSFFADGNGNITSGMMDINNTVNDPVNPTFTGTYVIHPNGLGFLYFNIATLGTRTFAVSMMASGNANIIEYDDINGGGTRNSGVLLIQDPNAFSTALGNGATYAFGFLGIDSGKNRFGLAGEFQSDGAGKFTSGSLDSDDAILGPSGSLAFMSGSTYTVAPNGRGTINIKTAQGSTGYTFYIVTAAQLLVIETDTFPTGGNPLVSGTILGQTSNSAFNSTGVFELTALDTSGLQAESQVGLFEGTIVGSFNLTESDQNTGSVLTRPTGSGTYSITNGRVALMPSPSGSGFQNSTPTSQPVLYMVSNNQAFIIGSDAAVSFGFMTPQVQPGTYTSASLSGTYAGGSLAPVEASVSNVVSIAIAGSNALNITDDASGPSGLILDNQTAATTSVEASGRVTVTVTGNTAEILYLVSPAPVPPAQGPPGQFFSLSLDSTARVDNFQQ